LQNPCPLLSCALCIKSLDTTIGKLAQVMNGVGECHHAMSASYMPFLLPSVISPYLI